MRPLASSLLLAASIGMVSSAPASAARPTPQALGAPVRGGVVGSTPRPRAPGALRGLRGVALGTAVVATMCLSACGGTGSGGGATTPRQGPSVGLSIDSSGNVGTRLDSGNGFGYTLNPQTGGLTPSMRIGDSHLAINMDGSGGLSYVP